MYLNNRVQGDNCVWLGAVVVTVDGLSWIGGLFGHGCNILN